MTTKELTAIVTANSLAMAEHTKAMAEHGRAMAELNKSQAENSKSIAQLVQNSLILHDSIKSLETTALAHDAQIDELIEGHKSLQKEWEAYLRRQPRT